MSSQGRMSRVPWTTSATSSRSQSPATPSSRCRKTPVAWATASACAVSCRNVAGTGAASRTEPVDPTRVPWPGNGAFGVGAPVVTAPRSIRRGGRAMRGAPMSRCEPLDSAGSTMTRTCSIVLKASRASFGFCSARLMAGGSMTRVSMGSTRVKPLMDMSGGHRAMLSLRECCARLPTAEGSGANTPNLSASTRSRYASSDAVLGFAAYGRKDEVVVRHFARDARVLEGREEEASRSVVRSRKVMEPRPVGVPVTTGAFSSWTMEDLRLTSCSTPSPCWRRRGMEESMRVRAPARPSRPDSPWCWR
mmetsp:Transcript_11919/g.34402  ORF Transcript_11919/g.34402 Transcript_11919/m.34402 type:complete len:306 (-) Transcript_11919:1338-2255(-)